MLWVGSGQHRGFGLSLRRRIDAVATVGCRIRARGFATQHTTHVRSVHNYTTALVTGAKLYLTNWSQRVTVRAIYF